MVTSTSVPQGRPNKFTDVGVVGRYAFNSRDVLTTSKTGLMVKDTGRRNSADLEDMDAFFSPAIEKLQKEGALSPREKLLSSKTKFLTSLQGDEAISMSGTS